VSVRRNPLPPGVAKREGDEGALAVGAWLFGREDPRAPKPGERAGRAGAGGRRVQAHLVPAVFCLGPWIAVF
jgi:hypothetical protein